MRASVIEFKLLGETYCFNTRHVSYVFELEEFNPTHGFHDAVKGITKYNNDVMLLIDTATLYSGKNLSMEGEKSVIVIHDAKGMYYGMLVDEIVKLEEVEEANPTLDLNTEEMIINHYKDPDEDLIVNEIFPLPLLEKYHIPAMATLHLNNEQTKQLTQETKQSKTGNYLLFKVHQKFYAVASKYVKEVLENDFNIFELSDEVEGVKGAIALRNEVVQVVDLGAKKGEDLVILERKGSVVALEVDTVYDIEDFTISLIEYLDDPKSDIQAFYNHNGDVIAILNPRHFLDNKALSRGSNNSSENTLEHNNEMQEYLIFYIDHKKYSIAMGSVRQVVESDAISKTHSSAIGQEEDVVYLATWNHHAINVFKLDNMLQTTTKEEDTQIIFIESDGKYGAFLVDDIENIVYLKESAVSHVMCKEQNIISGAILYEDEVIAKINENYLIGLT